MGRHTIGTKRGSVRGAPPQIYAPFGSYGDCDDHIKASVKFFADWLVLAIGFVVVMLVLIFYVGITDGE